MPRPKSAASAATNKPAPTTSPVAISRRPVPPSQRNSPPPCSKRLASEIAATAPAKTHPRARRQTQPSSSPPTPQHLGDNKYATVQIQEQHSQSIPLRLVEDGQEVGPSHECERCE